MSNNLIYAILAGLIVLWLSGCAEGRYLDAQQAAQFCAQNPPGRTYTMNPFGAEYSTWVSYCSQQWSGQTLAGISTSAAILQNQQALNIAARRWATPQITNCRQVGSSLSCTTIGN